MKMSGWFRRRAGKKNPRFKKLRRIRNIISLLLLSLVIGLLLFLNSSSFQERVRQRVIAELELVTGGKVEIRSFTWSLSRLQFEIEGLTIHGLEPAGTAPFIQADRLFVRATVTSWFSQQIALRYVAVDHPVVHLIVFPNGSTNQPVPKILQENKSPIDHLFELAINRMEITKGEVIWDQQAAGLDLTGKNLSVTMLYSAKDKSYDGKVKLDLLSEQAQKGLPFPEKVDLHFLMHPVQTEILAFQFGADRSHLEGSGTISNYNNPEVNLRYTASIELPEFASWTKAPELKGGHLTAHGTAIYSNKSYSSQGELSIQGASWTGPGFHVAGIEASSPFSITPEKISLTHLVAHLLGGTLQGDVQVANWSAFSPPSRALSQNGTATLKFSGMQVRHLATAISGPRLRSDRLNLVGVASGDLKTSWTGEFSNAITEVKLESNAPGNPLPEQVPVTARLEAIYHSPTRVIDLNGLSLATRSIRLSAAGKLGSTSAQVDVAFNANDLRELQPILAALSPGTIVPAAVEGRVSFTGSVFGKLGQLSAQGHLDTQNFDTTVATSASSSKTPQRIHWDSLIADLVYTPQSLTVKNGTVRRGTAHAGFSGLVGLSRGSFDPDNSQITGDVRLQDASIDDLKKLAGLSYPVNGILNATLHVAGTLQNLRSNGNMVVTKMTFYDEPFRLLRADFSLAGSQTQFSNILLAHNGTQFVGSAAYNLQSRQMRFDIRGIDIELASFRRFQPQRITMQGRADFHASGSGTPDAPQINAQLTSRNVVLNGERVGDLTAEAETQGDEMHVHGSSTFQNASLDLDGNVHLRGDFPGEFTLKVEHLDVDPFITAYLNGAKITGHSEMQGVIVLRGPVKSPRAMSVTANIDQLSADVENVRVHNVGPLRFSVEKEVAKVDQFHLAGDELDLSMHGTAQLAGAQQLDLHADGRLNLKLLQTFNQDLVSSGTTNLILNVGGSLSKPQMQGRMEIADGSLSFTDLPNGLSRINGSMTFASDRMHIESLTAYSGGGKLTLGGFIAYRSGVYFDVTATSEDVRLRYPPGISASANAGLRFTGSTKSSQLSGNVTVTRFAVNPRFDFAQYLALTKSPIKTSIRNPVLDNMRLDVHIVSTPELRVETSLAKLTGDVDLRLRGTVSSPVVLGRVNIVQGDIFFNATQYRLEHGDITFSNPLVIEPVIDVSMGTRVRGYDITIGFHGPVDHLSVTYRSDPPLPSGDIVALLAFGRTRQDELYTSSQSNQGLSSAVNTFLGEAVTSASNSRVQKLFGVSRVKIDPQVGGPENNPNPRVTIEQQLNNNITVTYVTNISQSASQQLIQVEYNVTRNISIVAVRDQNGILSFDVHYRQRKR